MVVTDLPSTRDIGVAQERVACPSMCTVQAPHDAMPHPNLVPVSFRCSRRTQSSGVFGSTPSSLLTPLTVKATMRFLHSPVRKFVGSRRLRAPLIDAMARPEADESIIANLRPTGEGRQPGRSGVFQLYL